jgi:N-acetylglucosamine kinase-like BadF-type ATPase
MTFAVSASRPSEAIVLAVDGGNVKTDLALVSSSGELLSLVRGGRSSPHFVGIDGCVELLGGLLAEAFASAGVDGHRPRTAVAEIMVAGADLPEELTALRAAIERVGWTDRLVIDNDTLALLRSGTDRGWGVAVVCGGGINCIGLAPDGREARFPSLGWISGDWGGGYDIGVAAVTAAARSADGRGPRTVLESAVPEYYGLSEPFDVARALHLGELPVARLGELARVVFPAAAQDAVAAGIVCRLADEVTALAAVAIRRLGLADQACDVVLGGGLIRASSPAMLEQITRGVREVAPAAQVLVAPSAPIVGAALLGLDAFGAGPAAAERARSELQSAFVAIEGAGVSEALATDGDGRQTGTRSRQLSKGAHG